MHRLFVAIRPPQHIVSLLLALTGGISGARWQTEAQIHLTLRFIGEVDRHCAGDVHAALGTVRHPRFDVAVQGLGAFDRRGQPELVWAGVAPHAPLKTLHKKIDQALIRAGLPPEARAYRPHITLGRLKRGSGPVGGFLEQPAARSAPFEVGAFCLFESTLTPDGAVYSLVERYPLD